MAFLHREYSYSLIRGTGLTEDGRWDFTLGGGEKYSSCGGGGEEYSS